MAHKAMLPPLYHLSSSQFLTKMTLKPVPMASTQTTPAQAPKIKCLVCKKSTFRTAEALQSHQTALGHQHVPCSRCSKEFGTKKAMEMHKRTCGKPTKPKPVISKSTSTVQPQVQVHEIAMPPLPFHYQQQQQQQQQELGDIFMFASLLPVTHCNGHLVTVLSTTEQDLIYKYLLSRCHSFNRLQSQKYTLPATAVARNVKAPGSGIKRAEFRELPSASKSISSAVLALQYTQKRRAIAIDCEMVEVVDGGRRELALLTAVDFLTGEVLINHYVEPTAKVKNWKSDISGVAPAAMAAAVAAGQALRGWKAARQALWEFVNDQTVFVGQALNHDLDVLGIFPGAVVDSAILTSEAVFPAVRSTLPLKRMWSLKTLARELLGYEIQMGNKGHDCLEDTMSTREIVIWCLRNPEQLRVWAENARDQHEAKEKERNAKGKKKRYGSEKVVSRGRIAPFSSGYGYVSEDEEVLRWSDIAEDLGWPHPDTGYDPWSD